jgi:predicted MFS family arabinose efflux permease
MFDRWGPRWLLLSGSVAWVASLFIMAQCETYWQFMLVFGTVAGVANALLTTTGVAVVAHWFEAKRGQANGIIFIGSSLGGISMPLMMRPLLERLGWAWAMRVLVLYITVLMLIGNLLIRGRLPKGTRGGAVDLRCFWIRDLLGRRLELQVLLILPCAYHLGTVLTNIGSEFVLFGVLGLLSEYALQQGFDSQTSFNVLAVLNRYAIPYASIYFLG